MGTPDTHTAFNQHTLKDSFSLHGVGLHSGVHSTISVFPSKPNTGIVFQRRDVNPGKCQIVAQWNNVVHTFFGLTIQNRFGVQAQSIGYILAALYANAIDNAIIVLDEPEVPTIDGSAKRFVEHINSVGIVEQNSPRRTIVIHKPISLQNEQQYACFTPSKHSHIDTEIRSTSSLIGCQRVIFPLTQAAFNQEIGDARNFVIQNELSAFKKIGYYKGASELNTVLVGANNIINSNDLRHENEFVRNSAANTFADLALMGGYLIGLFTSRCSDHKFNQQLIQMVMENDDNWDYQNMQNTQKH